VKVMGEGNEGNEGVKVDIRVLNDK